VSARRSAGSLVLVGGGEWQDGDRALDAQLLTDSNAPEVVVLPTAAAFEHPERVAARAEAYFGALGASTRTLDVVHRREADDPQMAAVVRKAKFVYLADGSPLHLRSVLKGSAVFEAMVASYRAGGVLAASGAGATLLCDPMVDPRGGAYTVGLGVVENLAVFPYHGTAATHLRERSINLLPASAVLAGIDEQTALVLRGGAWTVAGPGVVTVYAGTAVTEYRAGDAATGLPAA
jgi:cyanophycinase